MSRKRLKQVLLIVGIVIITAGLVIFIIDIGSFSALEPRGFKSLFGDVILPFYIFALIGVTALGAAAFMHSNDISKTKRTLSVVFKAFACFWIVGAALSAAALVLIVIFL